MVDKKYDIIIYGATGFTGKLICDYIYNHKENKLINLDNIPKTLESEILNSFNEASYGDRSGLLNYFIEKRLTSLTENIGEF